MDRVLLSLHPSELRLSVRARNCLQKGGVETIGDLVRKTPSDLLAMRSLGVTTLAEIGQALAGQGLQLGTGEQDVAVALAAADETALAALQAFLDGLRLAGCEEVADVVALSEEDLAARGTLARSDISAIQDGLRRWGLRLDLEVTAGQLNDADDDVLPGSVATFREELLGVVAALLAGKPASWSASFLAHRALSGGESQTLDVIGASGAEYGFSRSKVSRQAVQQVCARAEKTLRGGADRVQLRLWNPAVDRVQRELPGSFGTFLQCFGYRGGPEAKGSFYMLKEVADIFGLAFPFEVGELGSKDWFVVCADTRVSAWLAELAGKSSSAYCDFRATVGELRCEAEWLRGVIGCSRRLEFLDDDQRYFWKRPRLPPKSFSKTINPILTSLCNVFSVAKTASSPMLAASLGGSRMLRKDGPARVLPVEVVEGIATRSGLFEVENGQISRRRDVEAWCALWPRELALLRVGAEYGSVVSSRDLYPALVRQGLSEGNANQVIEFSPFLVHSERGGGAIEGVYKFVLDPALIDFEEVGVLVEDSVDDAQVAGDEN